MISMSPGGRCETDRSRGWRRARRRPWARQPKIVVEHVAFSAIPSLPRAELARLTQRMIDRMDDIDHEEERHD